MDLREEMDVARIKEMCIQRKIKEQESKLSNGDSSAFGFHVSNQANLNLRYKYDMNNNSENELSLLQNELEQLRKTIKKLRKLKIIA
jgi:hypothetical protein